MSSLHVRSYIRLHTPDARVQNILTSCDRHSVLDSLPKLFELTSAPTQLGHGFSLEVGVSNDTHIFVFRDRRLNEGNRFLIADVFAVEGQEPLTPDEVFNSARQHYQSDFGVDEDVDRSLTPYHFPQNCTVYGQSECFVRFREKGD